MSISRFAEPCGNEAKYIGAGDDIRRGTHITFTETGLSMRPI